jgi:ABC-type antimicrobial peptide transport system ATPase subunit
MRVYDVLDTVGIISEEARIASVQMLANDTQMINTIDRKLETDPNVNIVDDVLISMLHIDTILTDIQLNDLKDILHD